MVYGPRKKKISQFTAGSAVTDDTKYSSLQDGINKTFTHEQLIADFADVYGASLRTFEFESDLVVSDIQIDEYCIVEENRYTLYKITSAAANLPNIALDSGFTAERVRILQQASPSTYAEILAENPDLYAADDVIYLSGDGIADNFVVTTGAIPDSSTGVQLSNATWNAAGKHLARIFTGFANPKWWEVTGLGVADESANFQLAVNSGFPLLVPSGQYLFQSPVTLLSDSVIIGVNKETVSFYAEDCEEVFHADTKEGIILGNFTVRYSDDATTNTWATNFTSCDRVHLYNIDCYVQIVGRFRNCTYLTWNNIFRGEIPDTAPATATEVGGSLFTCGGASGCHNIMGNMLIGRGLAEGIDFGLCSNIVLSDLDFESVDYEDPWDGTNAGSEDFEEGIDLGAVSNVKISNFRIKGFGRGFFIKEEASTACSDIQISNGSINDWSVAAVGIFSRAGYTPGSDDPCIQGVKVSNVEGHSSRTNSLGVQIYDSGETSGADDVTFDNVTLSAQARCVYAAAVTNLTFNGGKYESLSTTCMDFVPTIGGTTVVCEDIKILGPKLIAKGTSGTLGAVKGLRIKNLTVRGCDIDSEVRGVLTNNVYNPVIEDNYCIAAERFISLTWTTESWLIGDSTINSAPFTVHNNRSKLWNENWLFVVISGIGSDADPYIGGRVTHNELLPDELNPTASTQRGISFEGVATDVLDGTICTHNLIHCSTSQTIRGTGQLGANALVADNVEITT